MVLEKTLESPLDCKEIQPVHSEGDQPWDFFGRNDAKAETPASVISAVIAVFVGIAAATGSGRMDSFINWVIDLMMGVPHMVLIMLISVAFGRGLKGLLIGVAATHWCSLARLIRAEVMQLRSQYRWYGRIRVVQ